MSPQQPDRRQVHRVTFQGVASLHCGNQQQTVELIDLSLQGALVALPSEHWDWPSNAPCHLNLSLGDEIEIDFNAHVVRREGNRLGLHIDELDLESIQHLRRLVELNLGDPELLSRDLAALFHTAP